MKLSEHVCEFMCATNEYLKCKYCPETLHPDKAEAMLNEHALLEAKLTAIECGDCGLTMLECACDEVE